MIIRLWDIIKHRLVQYKRDPVTGGIGNLVVGNASEFYLTKWIDSAKKARAYALKSIRPVMAVPPTVTTPANLSAITGAVALTPNAKLNGGP